MGLGPPHLAHPPRARDRAGRGPRDADGITSHQGSSGRRNQDQPASRRPHEHHEHRTPRTQIGRPCRLLDRLPPGPAIQVIAGLGGAVPGNPLYVRSARAKPRPSHGQAQSLTLTPPLSPGRAEPSRANFSRSTCQSHPHAASPCRPQDPPAIPLALRAISPNAVRTLFPRSDRTAGRNGPTLAPPWRRCLLFHSP